MNPNSKSFLPSKKILILLGGVLTFFVIFFGYSPITGAIKRADFRGTLSYSGDLNASAESAIDSDNDGLPDWQEKIWKTDLQNPDSDGDGTKDGEEVSTGRDPTKAGPDDKFTELINATAIADSASYLNDPNNLSQQLAQTIFTQTVLSESGGEIDNQSQEEILNKSMGAFQSQNIATKYNVNNIKTLGEINKNNIKSFGNSLIIIQDQADKSLDTSTTNEELIRIYSNLVNQLLQISAPQELKADYLVLVNNYDQLSQILVLISQESEDPVKALLNIKTFQALTEKNQNIYQQFSVYFKKNGIIWNTGEAGEIWNNF